MGSFILVLLLLLVVVAGAWHFLPKQLVGEFQGDDNLVILVNGKIVHNDPSKGWGDIQKVAFPVGPGDRVDFVVKNSGGPGGLIGKWSWKLNDYVVNTMTLKNVDANDNPLSMPIYDAGIKFGNPWNTAADAWPAGAIWVWRDQDANTICGWNSECTNTFTWIAPNNFILPARSPISVQAKSEAPAS